MKNIATLKPAMYLIQCQRNQVGLVEVADRKKMSQYFDGKLEEHEIPEYIEPLEADLMERPTKKQKISALPPKSLYHSLPQVEPMTFVQPVDIDWHNHKEREVEVRTRDSILQCERSFKYICGDFKEKIIAKL